MASSQQFLDHTMPRRGSTESIRSSGSTGSDKDWEECCRHLHAAGITTDMLRDTTLRDDIMRVLVEGLSPPAAIPPEELAGDSGITASAGMIWNPLKTKGMLRNPI